MERLTYYLVCKSTEVSSVGDGKGTVITRRTQNGGKKHA